MEIYFIHINQDNTCMVIMEEIEMDRNDEKYIFLKTLNTNDYLIENHYIYKELI